MLCDDLGELARKLADLIVGRLLEPSAISRAGELRDLLRRGRPLMLQGAASTLADRLGTALSAVGVIADSAGTIYRQET